MSTVAATWITQAAASQAVRFGVHQGGTRSGKTYNIAIALVHEWEAREGWTLSVVRKTFPALRATVYRDVLEVLAALELYDPSWHNKTEHLIVNPRSGSTIEFFSCDEPQKVRGRKRNLLWLNEANELTAEDFRQLNLRTTDKVWLDFNPSMQEHWIWDLFEGDSDFAAQAEWHRSTYRDNPFLPAETVRQIEALRLTDPYAWAVYGLGQRGASPAAVYPTTYECGAFGEASAETVYGLDFGYNDPTVLLAIRRRDVEGAPALDFDQVVYETHLTTDDLVSKMKDAGVPAHASVYCDGAEPDRIEQLQRAGFFGAQGADKTKGSVRGGIDFLKRHRLHFTPRSTRARSDFRQYRWKVLPDETVTDEPAHDGSHAPDAGRYGAYTHWAHGHSWIIQGL